MTMLTANTLESLKGVGFKGYKGEIVNGNSMRIVGNFVEVLKGIRRYSEQSENSLYLNYYGFEHITFETIEEAIEYMEDGTHDIDIDERQVIFSTDVMAEKTIVDLDSEEVKSLFTEMIEAIMTDREKEFPCYGTNADYMFQAVKKHLVDTLPTVAEEMV